MSKYELQEQAQRASGVTVEESEEALHLQPSIYDRIGTDGFYELSQLFYNRIFDDSSQQWFLNIFSSSTKSEAIDNQYRFFVQTFGGPYLYKEKKGKYTRLVGRHANYYVRTRAANHWFEHMKEALNCHSLLSKDVEARTALEKYFLYTAHYIVAASQYMRSDQLSGGTQIDEGRVW